MFFHCHQRDRDNNPKKKYPGLCERKMGNNSDSEMVNLFLK